MSREYFCMVLISLDSSIIPTMQNMSTVPSSTVARGTSEFLDLIFPRLLFSRDK